MSIDRYKAVIQFKTYHTPAAVHKANYVVLYSWVHAFFFALPLLFQNESAHITQRLFVERCLCGLTEGGSTAFTVLLIILCYISPLLITCIFLNLVASTANVERRRIKSLNNAEYAEYCLKESVLLNEARCGKFVGYLFVCALILKGPIIMVDLLTQLGVESAYIAQTDSVTVEATNVYYQTALAWLMFSYSAIFPILTFIYFHEHWRRLRYWMSCRKASVSTNVNNAANRRQVEQKRRRERQQHQPTNYNGSNRASIRAVDVNESFKQKKTLSTVSSNVSNDNSNNHHSNSSTSRRNPADAALHFRVPTLYPSNDGLHLLTSDKNSRQFSDRSSRNTTSWLQGTTSVSSGTNNDNKEEGGVRASSVIDERNDVAGSVSVLSAADDEDSVYLNSDLTYDEDTERDDDELDISANSRTLIWPHHHNSSLLPMWKEEQLLGDDQKARDDETMTQLSISTMIPTLDSFPATNDADGDGPHFPTDETAEDCNWADKRFGHANTNQFHNHINAAFHCNTDTSGECLESISNVDVRDNVTSNNALSD